MRKTLQVMKFGGTSVGDASCIDRVVEIIRTAARESSVAVVVSAMSGVTNRLIAAANQSKAGNESAVAESFAQLRKQHDEAVAALIHSAAARRCLQTKLHNLFAEGERLCQGTILLRELTPRTLDGISGLGERLCAPIVAAALSVIGVASESIDATELVVTDSYHGGAEPWIDLTRARCQARAVPLLQKGIVPVVTGFIGATEEGIPTTLGRGGSDYSATILGAALDAGEVVIWSDVPGLLTADPRLVPEACTIPEISYREAAELAYFGAKVLHPKTLRPVMQRGIPIWIRNTFAPDEPGTKITPTGPANSEGVRALTAISDAALITVAGPGTQAVPDVLARTVATAAAVRADVLLISQSSPHNDICLVIPSPLAKRTVEALRHEFSQDLVHETVEHTVFDAAVSVITLVGQNLRTASGTVVRTFAALGRENVNIIATVQGSSDCSMSFVVPQRDMKIAVASIHRELELGSLPSTRRPVTAVASPSAIWKVQSEQASAD
jgi:bifunctional aspartokinase / homoserine dehydrogenase 1